MGVSLLSVLALAVAVVPTVAIAAQENSVGNNMGGSDLGRLLILSRLFDNGDTGDLGDLFLLDRLFSGQDGAGLFNGDGGTNLGDLFLLERLFND